MGQQFVEPVQFRFYQSPGFQTLFPPKIHALNHQFTDGTPGCRDHSLLATADNVSSNYTVFDSGEASLDITPQVGVSE